MHIIEKLVNDHQLVSVIFVVKECVNGAGCTPLLPPSLATSTFPRLLYCEHKTSDLLNELQDMVVGGVSFIRITV